MHQLEEYITVGTKRMRCGYTTGTCAAAAARAAAELLLRNLVVPAVTISTPAGVDAIVEIEEHDTGDGWAACAVRKDSGDDPDVTNGTLVCARVERREKPGVEIDGGVGVGDEGRDVVERSAEIDAGELGADGFEERLEGLAEARRRGDVEVFGLPGDGQVARGGVRAGHVQIEVAQSGDALVADEHAKTVRDEAGERGEVVAVVRKEFAPDREDDARVAPLAHAFVGLGHAVFRPREGERFDLAHRDAAEAHGRALGETLRGFLQIRLEALRIAIASEEPERDEKRDREHGGQRHENAVADGTGSVHVALSPVAAAAVAAADWRRKKARISGCGLASRISRGRPVSSGRPFAAER